MAFKFVSIVSLLIVATAAQPLDYHQQGLTNNVETIAPSYGDHLIGDNGQQQGNYKEDDYNHGPAEYQYSYAVHDDHTGDIKSQQEERKGDVVHGRYELIDSDGYRRIVEYTADDHNGFQAVVHREPTDIKIPVPERHYQNQHIEAAAPHYSLNEHSDAYQSAGLGLRHGNSGKIAYVSSTAAPLAHYSAASDDSYGADYASSGHNAEDISLGDVAASYQH